MIIYKGMNEADWLEQCETLLKANASLCFGELFEILAARVYFYTSDKKIYSISIISF